MNNRNKALSFNCLRQCGLLGAGQRLLNEPEQHCGAHKAPQSLIGPGAFFCLHTPSTTLPPPAPTFPSVRNLYFISELWSSSAQLSADKAQEALERRHGYLDWEGGEGAGETKGRQAGKQAGTQPPRGTSPSLRYFFFSSLSFFLFSLFLTDSQLLPSSLTFAAEFN